LITEKMVKEDTKEVEKMETKVWEVQRVNGERRT
jgi:hypothetical protein